MQLKKKRLIPFALCVIIFMMIAYLWFTTPPVDKVTVISDHVTIRIGETKEIIKDVYPDASFNRFNIVSEDPSVAETMNDKFSVKGVKEGNTVIKCMDKKEIIKVINITVIP